MVDPERLLAVLARVTARLRILEAEVMAGAAGFRNVLVHDYAEVDDVRSWATSPRRRNCADSSR
jgi:uncharacterized protein with HEPN domain